jgi:hypothetical protein
VHEELLSAVSQCSCLPIAFDIEYRPYCIVSSIPEDAPVDKKSFYMKRYGPEKSKTRNNGVLAWGKELGLTL